MLQKDATYSERAHDTASDSDVRAVNKPAARRRRCIAVKFISKRFILHMPAAFTGQLGILGGEESCQCKRNVQFA